MKNEGRTETKSRGSRGQQDIQSRPLPGPFCFRSPSSTPSNSSQSPSPTQTIPWLRWGPRQHTGRIRCWGETREHALR